MYTPIPPVSNRDTRNQEAPSASWMQQWHWSRLGLSGMLMPTTPCVCEGLILDQDTINTPGTALGPCYFAMWKCGTAIRIPVLHWELWHSQGFNLFFDDTRMMPEVTL